MGNSATWHCHKSGCCCRNVGAVTMTPAERREIEQVASGPFLWREIGGGFVQLVGDPACPLLDGDGRCTVYAVRPFNCRRWGCFRPTTDEPFALAVQPDPISGDTMPVRLYTSKPVARQMARMAMAASPWAMAHGWRPETD